MRSPPARRSLSWIQSLLIDLWLLVIEVSTLSLILLTTQAIVTTGSSPHKENLYGKAGNRTRDLVISSQKLWPLDHEAGQVLKCITITAFTYLCNLAGTYYELPEDDGIASKHVAAM